MTWFSETAAPFQASGVAVDDECLKVYEEIKLRRKYKYVVYRMNDNDTKIIVDFLGMPGKDEINTWLIMYRNWLEKCWRNTDTTEEFSHSESDW